jgi:hypothetical protein
MSIGPDKTQPLDETQPRVAQVEHYINRVAEALCHQCASMISTQLMMAWTRSPDAETYRRRWALAYGYYLMLMLRVCHRQTPVSVDLLDTIADSVWVPVHLVCLLFFLWCTPLLEPYRDHYREMIASIAAMVSPPLDTEISISSEVSS